MTLTDVLTLFAIVLGPAGGAALAIWLEKQRAKRERRLDIFRTLMRTRRNPMWPDHVGALNLVEIEFQDDPSVLAKWKELFKHLGTPHPRQRSEEVNDAMQEHEKRERDNQYGMRLSQERQELLTGLLHAIGKIVGFGGMEQLEIFKGGYTPQGWDDIDLENRLVRRLFADIYIGKRIFPIGVFHFPGQSVPDQETELPDTSEPNATPEPEAKDKI